MSSPSQFSSLGSLALDMLGMMIFLIVGLACGGVAGALVMKKIVVTEAQLAGCEVTE